MQFYPPPFSLHAWWKFSESRTAVRLQRINEKYLAHVIALLEYLETTEKRVINYFYAANKKRGVKISTKKTKGDTKHLHTRKNTLGKWNVIKLQHTFTFNSFFH